MNLPLPAVPGAYALHLVLYEPREIEAGRLGKAVLLPGNYLYFGSANGPGGIRARLGRHLRGGQRLHWHIDYLRACARVQTCFYLARSAQSQAGKRSEARLECLWSQAIAVFPDAFVPFPGFGSSDCRAGCPAHLLAFPPGVDMRRDSYRGSSFIKRIQAALANAAGVPTVSVMVNWS